MSFKATSERERTGTTVNPRQEVIISIKQDREKATKSPPLSSQHFSGKELYSHIGILRRDLESKSSPELPFIQHPTLLAPDSSSPNVSQNTASRPPIVTSVSSSSTVSSTGLSSTFSKSITNTSSSGMSTVSATSSKSGTSTMLEEKHSRCVSVSVSRSHFAWPDEEKELATKTNFKVQKVCANEFANRGTTSYKTTLCSRDC